MKLYYLILSYELMALKLTLHLAHEKGLNFAYIRRLLADHKLVDRGLYVAELHSSPFIPGCQKQIE
jgi:hypothetical protein